MRNVLCCVIAAALATGSWSAGATESPGNMSEMLKGYAPDVSHWDVVADGFHRGVSSDGSIVKVFTGVAGARVVYAMNADELHTVSQEFESLAKSDSQGAVKKLEAAGKRMEILQLENDRLREVIEDNERRSAEKATQNFSDNETVCSANTRYTARFSATPSGTNWVNVESWGKWFPVNEVPVGPPPPAPYLYERYIQASAIQSSHYVQDSVMSADQSVPIEVGVIRNTTSSCSVRIRQSVRCRTLSTSPLSYGGVQRDNTCAGVVANTPPTVVDL